MSNGIGASTSPNLPLEYERGVLYDSLSEELKAYKAGDTNLTMAAMKSAITAAPNAGIQPDKLNRLMADAQSPQEMPLTADIDFVRALKDPVSLLGPGTPSPDLTQSASATSAYPTAAATGATSPASYGGAATTAPSYGQAQFAAASGSPSYLNSPPPAAQYQPSAPAVYSSPSNLYGQASPAS